MMESNVNESDIKLGNVQTKTSGLSLDSEVTSLMFLLVFLVQHFSIHFIGIQ